MKLSASLTVLGINKSMEIARQEVLSMGLIWEGHVEHVFRVCLNDESRCPDIGKQNDPPERAIYLWVKKYKDGYENRPSKSCGKPSKTIPDPIIDEMIGTRIKLINEMKLNEICFAHRLSMSAENVLGLFLEEYIAIKLLDCGWVCAWGQTLRSVDFCHGSGELLQVKNRSNTENSSSNKIRSGTKIKKWYRVDARTGHYFWWELEKLCGAPVSESDFRHFVIKSIDDC